MDIGICPESGLDAAAKVKSISTEGGQEKLEWKVNAKLGVYQGCDAAAPRVEYYVHQSDGKGNPTGPAVLGSRLLSQAQRRDGLMFLLGTDVRCQPYYFFIFQFWV